jgi:hypothetical protein
MGWWAFVLGRRRAGQTKKEAVAVKGGNANADEEETKSLKEMSRTKNPHARQETKPSTNSPDEQAVVDGVLMWGRAGEGTRKWEPWYLRWRRRPNKKY